jgi:two-component system CheB/CheR fusion protein
VPQAQARSIPSQSHAHVFRIDDGGDFDKTVDLFKANGLRVERYEDDAHFLASDHPERTGCLLINAASAAKSAAGLALLQTLGAVTHRISAILVVDRDDIRLATRAIRTGAFDVLENPIDHALLLSRVQQALGALTPARPPISALGRRVDRQAARAAWDSLTRRQREILDRIVLGQPNKIIAADLGISQRTAENHRAAIMRKMGASSIAALIQIAIAA